MWDSLCSREMLNTIENQQLSETHKLLLRNSSQSKCKSLTAYIVHGIRTIEEFSGAKFYKTMSKLDKLLQPLNYGIELTSIINDKTVTPVVFIDYVKEAGKNYKKYGLWCDEKTLQDFVSKNIPNGMQKFIALAEIKKEFDFDPIVRKLEDQIEQGEDELTVENVGLFFGFYKAISPDNGPIKSLDDQKIEELLPQLKTETDAYFDLIAMRLAKGENFPNKRGSRTQTVLRDTREELVEGIATRIEYYDDVGGLLESYLTWKPSLLKAVLNYIIDNDPHKTSRMSIKEVLPNFESLRSNLEIDGIGFIKWLDGWSEYAKEVVTTDNVYAVLPKEFFKYAVQTDCDLAKHAVSTMSDYLNSLSVSGWAELPNVDKLFYTTYWLIEQRIIPLPRNAIIFFKEFLVEVANGNFSMKPKEEWDVYYARTNKNSLKATAKNIRDLFIDNVNIDPDRFIQLSDLLLNHADLKNRSGDVVRKILTPVVDDRECMAFILDNKQYFVPLVKDAGDDASDFKDKLRVKVSKPDCDEMVIEFEKEIADDIEVP